MNKLELYDTTLRDGAQAEGISFSTDDKKSVSELLIKFGIDLVEGGNPASNPKDASFFAENKNPKLVAFGATKRYGVPCAEDESMKALSAAGTNSVCIVGKTSLSQVKKVLNLNAEQNLEIIRDSVKCLAEQNKRVIFDAEQFFDAYSEDRDYAVRVVETAKEAGADTVVLCDTSGGTFPDVIESVVREIANRFPQLKIGIHCHNDTGTAVASTLAAVKAGATQIQGTFLGFGERAGNCNLSTVIGDLALKTDAELSVDIKSLTPTAHKIAAVANISLDKSMPYVGTSAFSHKAGMHSDAVLKQSDTFEHVPPEKVGNSRRFLLSEISGKAAVNSKLSEYFPNLKKDDEKTKRLLCEIKKLEMNGYQFESADGSFVLLAEKLLGSFKPSFEITAYEISAKHPQNTCTAKVEICADGEKFSASANGNGPVNALDKALRRALIEKFPELKQVALTDYKVRVVDSGKATDSLVRVLITSKDGEKVWTTIGVSSDIIEASKEALCDSFEYKLTGLRNVGI